MWDVREDMSESFHLIPVTVRPLMVISRERVVYVDLKRAQHTIGDAQEPKPYRSTADL